MNEHLHFKKSKNIPLILIAVVLIGGFFAFRDTIMARFGGTTATDQSIKQVDKACNEALELVYKRGDSTQALKQMRQLEKQSGEVQRAVVQMHLGWLYMQYPNTSSKAIGFFTKAKPVLEKANEWGYVGQIKVSIARIYHQNTDIPMAQKYIKEAAVDLKKSKEEADWIKYYHELVSISSYLQDSTEAKLNYKKALELAKKHQQWREVAGIYTDMGILYSNFKKFEESRKCLVEAQETQKKHGYNQASSLYSLLYMEEDLVQYEKMAKAMIEEQSKGGDAPTITGKGYMALGDLYAHQKKYPQAIKMYEQSLKLIDAAKIEFLYVEIYESLFRYYKAIGNYQKSVEYSEKTIDHYVNYVEDRTSNQVQQQQDLYNLDKKNEEIEQLEKDKQTQRLIIILSLLSLLGGSGVFYLILKSRKLAEKTMKDRIAFQERELLSNTIYTEQRNDFLETLKQQIAEGQDSKKLLAEINKNVNFENDWDKFKLHFEQIHPTFFKKLLSIESTLSDLDLKQCAYLSLNLSPKQVANLLNVTPHAVSTSRTRIKKRLNLPEEENLADFLKRL